jgi:glutamate/tyrosine decarboxylase-like PLP-dependent enzyme
LQDVSGVKHRGVKTETGNHDIQIDLEQIRDMIEQVIDAKLQPVIKIIAAVLFSVLVATADRLLVLVFAVLWCYFPGH